MAWRMCVIISAMSSALLQGMESEVLDGLKDLYFSSI